MFRSASTTLLLAALALAGCSGQDSDRDGTSLGDTDTTVDSDGSTATDAEDADPAEAGEVDGSSDADTAPDIEDTVPDSEEVEVDAPDVDVEDNADEPDADDAPEDAEEVDSEDAEPADADADDAPEDLEETDADEIDADETDTTDTVEDPEPDADDTDLIEDTDAVDDTDVEDAEIDPWVELGTGEIDFVPLESSEELLYTQGFQGGFHVFGSVRYGGFAGEESEFFIELLDADGGAAGAVAFSGGFVEYAEGAFERTGLTVFLSFDFVPEDRDLETFEMRLTVTTPGGTALSDTATVVGRCCQYL